MTAARLLLERIVDHVIFSLAPGICEPLDDPRCVRSNSWLDCSSMLPFDCPAFEEPGDI